MKSSGDQDELFASAEEQFRAGRYQTAEPILNQLILRGEKRREVFHMLGTIYYDQGKFNKAIRSFRRALEIDPAFTDASVGLSIILNDLGRYEEGRQVFEEARSLLQQASGSEDAYINEKFALKHDELGEMYFRYHRYKEALEQYFKALNLSRRKPEISMKIVECELKLDQRTKAMKTLRQVCIDYPSFSTARIKMGVLLFETGDLVGATEEWEAVLQRHPDHSEALRLLEMAHQHGRTQGTEVNL